MCEGCVCVGVLAYYRYVDKWFGYPSILQIVSCWAMSWAFPDIGSSRQTLFSSLTLYTHMHTRTALHAFFLWLLSLPLSSLPQLTTAQNSHK